MSVRGEIESATRRSRDCAALSLLFHSQGEINVGLQRYIARHLMYQRVLLE